MKTARTVPLEARRRPALAAWLLGGVLLTCTVHAEEEPVATAVASKVSPDYVRARLADGTYRPESYAFGPGGLWAGMHDETIDRLKFIDVARVIAGPLAEQKYLPATIPAETNILIMVYWGLTTVPPPIADSPAFGNVQIAQTNLQMAITEGNPAVIAAARAQLDFATGMLGTEYQLRHRTDLQNGAMMGYDSVLRTANGLEHTALEMRRNDLFDELENNRYFVVLMAYDFQLLWKEKKHKLLWETRFSIAQRHNDFDRQLAAMAESASRYFGRDSHGLQRKPLPETSVNLGELKILGIEPEKK